jgi:uncharacterized protein (TIGR04255 family)
MRDSVPEVQDRLRKRFPRTIERVLPSIAFDADGGMPRVEQVALFEFQDADQKSGVILAESFLNFHTTAYQTYEEFEVDFLALTTQIHAVVDLGLLERCGLRYVDAISLRNGESLSQYVRPEMLGLDPKSIGSVVTSTSESVFRGITDVGTLVVRFAQLANIVDDAKFFPADLQPVSLKYVHHKGERLAGALDFDHFSTMSIPFEPKEAMQQLGTLHDAIDRAFRCSVLPGAFDFWEAEKLP